MCAFPGGSVALSLSREAGGPRVFSAALPAFILLDGRDLEILVTFRDFPKAIL